VDGILTTGGLSTVVAPYDSGKTFLALDVALSVAANRPWNNRNVKPGEVVYILGGAAAVASSPWRCGRDKRLMFA
jgi:RecA-family ATPase